MYNDMSWDLSRTSASEMPEKEEKGRKTARDKEDGMMDETYHAICFKKKRILFFLLFPAPVFEVSPLQCAVDQLHWKRIAPRTLCYLSRLCAPPPPTPHGKEERERKVERKDAF